MHYSIQFKEKNQCISFPQLKPTWKKKKKRYKKNLMWFVTGNGNIWWMEDMWMIHPGINCQCHLMKEGQGNESTRYKLSVCSNFLKGELFQNENTGRKCSWTKETERKKKIFLFIFLWKPYLHYAKKGGGDRKE